MLIRDDLILHVVCNVARGGDTHDRGADTMPLMRSLRPIDVIVPTVETKSDKFPDLPPVKLPLNAAIKFMSDMDGIKQTSRKRFRFFLCEKHKEVFGVYPNLDVPLEVVRARIVYRLQYEGLRIAGQTPSEKFLQNYKAVMAFNEEDFFKGCTRDVASLGTRLTNLEGVVTMSAVKAAKSSAKKLVKKAIKVARAAKTAAVKRPKIFNTYSMCHVLKYLAGIGCSVAQMEGVLKALRIQITPSTHSTVATTASDMRRGRFDKVTLEKEHVSRIKSMIPKEEKSKPAIKKAIKRAKK